MEPSTPCGLLFLFTKVYMLILSKPRTGRCIETSSPAVSTPHVHQISLDCGAINGRADLVRKVDTAFSREGRSEAVIEALDGT